MKIEIKHNYSGVILFEAEVANIKLAVELAIKQNADLRSADLSSANLRSADLRSANLRYADLRSADLSYANLSSAYLRSADLRSADLSSANLRSAKGLIKFLTTPLYALLDQIGKIRMYKLVNSDLEGPFHGGITYEKGKTYRKEADTDENDACSYGISLATLDWCMKEWRKGYRILIVEFTKKDIAAIPIGSDGKFRVSKCKVVGEKSLKELGLDKS